MRAFAAQHPSVRLERYDMRWLDSIEARRQYDAAFGVPEAHRFEVPTLFVDGEVYIGVEAIRDFVEGKGKPVRTPLQRAADRYGPTVLRWLLAAGLIGLALSSATGGRGHRSLSAAVRLFLGSVLMVSAVSKGIQLEATARSFGE
ncbi:MAG: hypothetical protein ACE149_11390 [Armatimonadota bacterium]